MTKGKRRNTGTSSVSVKGLKGKAHLEVINAPLHHFVPVILRVLQSMAFLRQASERALEACLAPGLCYLPCRRGKPKAGAWHVPMEPDEDRAGKKKDKDDEEVSRSESSLLDL